jgi:hypothetical protein
MLAGKQRQEGATSMTTPNTPDPIDRRAVLEAIAAERECAEYAALDSLDDLTDTIATLPACPVDSTSEPQPAMAVAGLVDETSLYEDNEIILEVGGVAPPKPDLTQRISARLQSLRTALTTLAAQLTQAEARAERAERAEDDRHVTCVYCGHQYEDGTPESQDARLTAHIKQCEKHPMRELEAEIFLLRACCDSKCVDALGVLMEALDTWNGENPWLGVCASVALLQGKATTASNERDHLAARLAEVERDRDHYKTQALLDEVARLRELVAQCVEAMEQTYEVSDYPANGKSPCDRAIKAARARLQGDAP